jgi:hypothetical protein
MFFISETQSPAVHDAKQPFPPQFRQGPGTLDTFTGSSHALLMQHYRFLHEFRGLLQGPARGDAAGQVRDIGGPVVAGLFKDHHISST